MSDVIPQPAVAPPSSDVAMLMGGGNQWLSNAASNLAANADAGNKASAAIVAATQASGADDITIATQKAQGLLAAQVAAQKFAASLGTGPLSTSDIMQQLGQKFTQAHADLAQADAVIQQKQSVAFVDDPLTWLSNKLTVGTDIANRNNIANEANDTEEQMNAINTLSTAAATTFKDIATTQTAATVAATSDQALQNATIANQKATLQGILFNANSVKDITQLTQDQIDNGFKAANLSVAQGELAVRQKDLVIQGALATARIGEYNQQVQDKQNNADSDAYVAGLVNKGLAASGGLVNNTPVPSSKILTILKMGGPAAQIYKDAFYSGSLTDVSGKPIIAPTAGSSARILATAGSSIAVANPAVKPITDLLASVLNNVKSSGPLAAQMGINLKDPNSVDSAVSSEVNVKLQGMNSNIVANDAGNVYQAPPLTALATMKGVQQNPLYAKVLAPLVQTGLAETDPSKLLDITTTAIQNGTISVQDAAAGLSSLFASAVFMNNSTKDFTRFGLAPQTAFNTTVKGDGTFGNSPKLDMTNKAQVTTAIMKQLQNKQANTAMFIPG